MRENLHQDGEGCDESGDRRLLGVSLLLRDRDQNRHGCVHHVFRVGVVLQDEALVGLARVVEWPLNALLELVQGLELLLT